MTGTPYVVGLFLALVLLSALTASLGLERGRRTNVYWQLLFNTTCFTGSSYSTQSVLLAVPIQHNVFYWQFLFNTTCFTGSSYSTQRCLIYWQLLSNITLFNLLSVANQHNAVYFTVSHCPTKHCLIYCLTWIGPGFPAVWL